MKHYKFLFFLLMLFPGFFAFAQSETGTLQFISHHFFNNKDLPYTQIKVTSKGTVISQLETEKSNSFKQSLAFGTVYDIYFTNAKCQTMFIRVFANIPAVNHTLKTTYELDIPFFPKDPAMFDTAQFRNPFHQIVFDGKSKFVDDTAYMNAFLKKVVRQYAEDTSDYFQKKPIHIKQYVQLVGKLSLENDKKTLLKNKTVTLVNKSDGKVFTAQTSNHGIFVFEGVDLDIAGGINVQLAPSDNPNHKNIKLETIFNETVDYASPSATEGYVFKDTEKNILIKKLIDKEYKYNIGGKLILNDKSSKHIASDKEVYLLGSKNNQLQKIKTDVFGNFLFNKIVPGQTYTIAFDTAEYGISSKLEMYTVKDKFVKRMDSLSDKRYLYKFTATSGTEFNNLLLDDSELKMNVKGRLYGDNKNNPLGSFKVLLLNDKYNTIDSAVTSKDGDFTFNYIPYNRQIMISAGNEKSILEAFNNILVFDNSENLIKIVSTVKGSKFDYKPLAIEQSRITEIYVDDPWLEVIHYKKGGKKVDAVIVENILFEFDKADLLSQSKQTLDKIILSMQINKEFKIELGAHSDS
ncbi:MAG: hypothetical protein V4506_17620, partial [Bacteroidota bacterium]